MRPYIIEEHADGLLVFTINRNEKRNAISYEVMDGLEEALSTASQDRFKALIITGEGSKAFCSGGDLSVFHGLRTEAEAYEMLSRMSGLLTRLLLFPKPTVALINGTAVGGGCELAAACDYRIAKRGIKAGFIQGTLAITTGWGGGTILAEKLSPANSMKMLMEASLYDTEQLLEMGFLQAVYKESSMENCRQFLNKMLSLEPEVLKAYKIMFINKWKESGIEERIKQEVRRCAVLWEGETHHQKVSQFMNRK